MEKRKKTPPLSEFNNLIQGYTPSSSEEVKRLIESFNCVKNNKKILKEVLEWKRKMKL